MRRVLPRPRADGICSQDGYRRFHRPARPHRDAGLRVFVQNDRSLVEANDRLQRIQLTGVEPEDVLHAIHELVADRRHAPHFFPATA